MPREYTIEEMKNIGSMMRAEHNPNQTTDAGNADRLAYLSGEYLKFVEGLGWLAYENGAWRPNAGKPLQDCRELVIPFIYAQAREKLAAGKSGAAAAQELINHAKRSESLAKMTAAVELASFHPKLRTTVDRFDVDPMLLNVKNGVIDLRTGELIQHSPSQLFMRQAAVEYRPDADCPTFLKFLDRIFAGDADLIRFIQTAIGYSLTGDISEQCWFICYGGGSNGKSTLLNTILEILAGYGQQAPPDLLLQGRGDEDKRATQMATLVGKRFALAQETGEGRALAEAAIKAMTGGDVVVARFLYQTAFSFKPTHKLWLATNSKPVVRDPSEGTWRRINLIPFDQHIPAAERDAKLPEKLKAELPGILRWAIDGCMTWQREGLTRPEAVENATKSYRSDSDVLTAFLTESCTIVDKPTPAAMTSVSKLYDVYRAWCEQAGEFCKSNRYFSSGLIDRGFKKVRKGFAYFWERIVLNDCQHCQDCQDFQNSREKGNSIESFKIIGNAGNVGNDFEVF